MKTNELKKGDKIRLRNGWYATIADNMKGNTRMAEVNGTYKEIGSIYSHDIVVHFNSKNEMIEIEYTPAQLKLKKMVSSIF